MVQNYLFGAMILVETNILAVLIWLHLTIGSHLVAILTSKNCCQTIGSAFHVVFIRMLHFRLIFSPVLISGQANSDEEKIRCIQPMRWGLVPSWHKKSPDEFGYKMINCRWIYARVRWFSFITYTGCKEDMSTCKSPATRQMSVYHNIGCS